MLTSLIENVHVHPAAWAVICAATLIAAVTDVHSRKIHNVLTLPLFLAGLVWAVVTGSVGGVGWGLVAALILGTPFILLFLFAGGGAGDAKLMMALGPWVGLYGGLAVLAAVCLTGMVFAVGYALIRGSGREVAGNLGVMGMSTMLAARGMLRMSDVPRAPEPENVQRMPYGLAICAGVWISAGGLLIWYG